MIKKHQLNVNCRNISESYLEKMVKKVISRMYIFRTILSIDIFIRVEKLKIIAHKD